MKFLPLIWNGLWRKPARTLLTLFSIVVAFILFGLLQGVESAFSQIIGQQKLDRMFVDSRFQQPIPLVYKQQIEKVKGITKITEIHFVGGFFREQSNGALIIFTRPDVWLAIRPEFEKTQEALDTVRTTRNAVIVSKWLAEHNGWKVGDTVTLKLGMTNKAGSNDWTFLIAGLMYNPEQQGGTPRQILANYEYLDEGRMDGLHTVSRFLLRIADASRSAQTAREIDTLFTNSAVQTRTQSEQDQAQIAVSRIGDIEFFTRAIMSAVFFALLFLTLNTTMESIRERTAELATLKTIGFSDNRILVLVLAESITLFLVAAAAGLAIAAAIFPLARDIVPVRVIPTSVLAIGAVLAVAAALISAIVPAIRAKRLNIVQALAIR
jgi:putative ABC transport system permease protein